MNNEYITIAEYARLKGITKQAAYKQADGKIKDYVRIIKGQKYIDIHSLEGLDKTTFEVEKVEQVEQKSCSTVNQLIQCDNNSVSIPEVKKNIDTEKDELIEFLKGQLLEKDKVIASLQETNNRQGLLLEEKDKYILEQSGKITDLLEKSQQLNENNQNLLAREQEIKLLEKSSQNSFFRRLFKKKYLNGQ